MNQQLQHDPRTKQQIKDLLYAFLYDPIQKQLKERLDALIVKNCLLIQNTHKSFHYKGVCYSCDTGPYQRRANRLSPLLNQYMEDYLKEVQALNEQEVPYVIGFINQVLNSSSDLRDYLRVLPTSIHRPIEQLIASCPCVSSNLSLKTVSELQERNAPSIHLMKCRMAMNLII